MGLIHNPNIVPSSGWKWDRLFGILTFSLGLGDFSRRKFDLFNQRSLSRVEGNGRHKEGNQASEIRTVLARKYVSKQSSLPKCQVYSFNAKSSCQMVKV